MINLNKYELGLGGGSLIQVANRSLVQMMSYIIDCPCGGVIVIDGGLDCEEDAAHLYSELEKRGKKVDLWIFTHCHCDHYGAWLLLAETGRLDIKIDKLLFNFPTEEWLLTKEDAFPTKRFFEAINSSEFNIVTPVAGDVFSVGGVDIEIISHPTNYENYPSINPTSIIFKAHFPEKSVLFLGDFDVNAEEDYKANFSLEKLKCEIVQMAHHGQRGVSREFYRYIEPRYCLYTAPDWLWENNKYKGKDIKNRGTGIFTIFETRLWMAEMNVIKSFYCGEGDWIFV